MAARGAAHALQEHGTPRPPRAPPGPAPVAMASKCKSPFFAAKRAAVQRAQGLGQGAARAAAFGYRHAAAGAASEAGLATAHS